MSHVAESELEIINQLGLHARAAAQLVQTANQFQSHVTLTLGSQTVNGKSIMGVLMLAAAQGMRLKVRCTGVDGTECLAAIQSLVKNFFGEGK